MPEKIDPQRAADQGRCLNGVADLALLERLRDMLVAPLGQASYELEFYRDDRRRACVRGRIEAWVRLQCQRCLEAVEVLLESELRVAFVHGHEEAQRLPEEYDPFLLEDGLFDPADLIEDELILAVPQIPMHAEAVCGGAESAGGAEDGATNAIAGADNPFAVLAELKKKLH